MAAIDIRDVQMLVFEIGNTCNLSKSHIKCPNHIGERRWRKLLSETPLDDATIMETSRRFCGEFGFTGLVGFHYYNEPLMHQERMFGLIARIQRARPAARFTLWTNGVLLPADCSKFAAFSQIRITDYGEPLSPRNLAAVHKACSDIVVTKASFDNRLDILGTAKPAACLRPYTEFVVDYYGNTHLCCQDWRGLASPGNIGRDGLDACVAKWRVSANAVIAGSSDAPPACLRCERKYTTATVF